MAYITEPELRGRLPLDGGGVSSAQIQLAINAAVAEVSGLTGDTNGTNALAQQAVVNKALAELFDTVIYPGDARRPGSESSALRAAADRSINAFLKIKADTDKDTYADPPPGYSGVMVF